MKKTVEPDCPTLQPHMKKIGMILQGQTSIRWRDRHKHYWSDRTIPLSMTVATARDC
jgi:hypothetical protein